MSRSVSRSVPPEDATVGRGAEQRHEAALEFLLGRINYERVAVLPYGQRQLKLDRMRHLLTRLGNPDAGLPIVHVAGTKGKGSTAALVGSILQAAGYEVGLFSSPHLEAIEERFAVNGAACPGGEFVELVDRLRPVVLAMDAEAESTGDSSLSPTYFELTTALALLHFADRKVDIAVLEVGLGGRLDSTNVCQPAVTVITSISLDHTKQLGETVELIAAEKAGILKPGVPVLCGPLEEGPRRVIAEIARQHGCRMLEAGRDFSHQYHAPRNLDHAPRNLEQQEALGRLDFFGTFAENRLELLALPLRLLGAHQAANAALAVATIVELRRQGWSVSEEAIRLGLAALSLPARVEILGRQPTVVLDVAHNVASAEALVDVLETCFASKRRILVLATTREKDVPGIVGVLLPYFDEVIATEYQENLRAVATATLGQIVREELATFGREGSAVGVHERTRPTEALALARELAEEGDAPLICITGSFFIAAELRRVAGEGNDEWPPTPDP